MPWRRHLYLLRIWHRPTIVIINESMRPLQDQFMQGALKEAPRRRQTRAFTKVGDLLSKPSKAMGATTSINLNLVGHSMVCKQFAKIFLLPVRSFFQVFWKEAFRMRLKATELNLDVARQTYHSKRT